MSQKITPFLWFDSNAEEAADFYVYGLTHGRVLTAAPAASPGSRPRSR
jgi:predicted 3-demethylubiquinone-9 3-methyltransferase (glyoxalase superfamily)